ncbi:MAG: alpha/beta hydrolase [Actinomycetota bacterium]|nr:alpha/beta hydrolase [Actinomycetota bacterium]MDD5666542.1 alpha/beta hydrolase [Actinomycetota bacterium]
MARFENITGRYVYLDVDGGEYRVYFEENGSGIPLLLQHTAGSDGRLWRHLLADEEIARHFRMIAYDIPYHGKTLPRLDHEWWKEEYKLRRDFLTSFVVTLARELELERPVYMGCSIGGHLAADLAYYYPDEFRAVIGIESAHLTPGLDQRWLYHPRINSEFNANISLDMMGPASPEYSKRETWWCYSQGAPIAVLGALNYHCVEHNLLGLAQDIDTSKVAVYLLTGEYDFSCPPMLTQMLADDIKGSRFQVIEGMGHFPMSEDPARFREYILPVLDEIRHGVSP